MLLFCKTIISIVAIIISAIVIVFLFMWITAPSPKKNPIVYKDFYVDDSHVFTIHLSKEYDGFFDATDIRIDVYEKHLPPTSRFEYLKQSFKLKRYDYRYLRSYDDTPLEYFIYEMIQNILKKEKSIIKREKNYQDFVDSSDNIIFKKPLDI